MRPTIISYIFVIIFLVCNSLVSAETMSCSSSFYTLACFKAYKTYLLSSHKQQLEKIADKIQDSRQWMTPIDQVTMVGHSAFYKKSDPADEMALERAINAAEYLQQALLKRGLRDIKITTGGVGTREPRTTNANQQGRNLNRRVEIFLNSRERFTSHLSDMKSYCSDVYGHNSYRVLRFQTQTCHSEEEANQICNAKVNLKRREKMIGAACLPLDIRCVVCKE